jgi:hypothetical protein
MPYTYTRPPAFPDYATDDVANGLGGANNVQEPPLGKKQQGHDYGEKPPREFMNWLHRTTTNWLKYADERITTLLTFMSDSQDNNKSKTAADADNYFRSQW